MTSKEKGRETEKAQALHFNISSRILFAAFSLPQRAPDASYRLIPESLPRLWACFLPIGF